MGDEFSSGMNSSSCKSPLGCFPIHCALNRKVDFCRESVGASHARNLWWWPNLIYFHDVFMNIFRKKWPVVGAFLHLVILPVPSLTKSCDLSTSGGCKDKMNKMRAYDPNKVVGPTIFYGASRNFLGKMKPILDEDFSSGWPDSSYYVVEGQFSRGLDRGSFPHKSRVKNLGQVSPFA